MAPQPTDGLAFSPDGRSLVSPTLRDGARVRWETGKDKVLALALTADAKALCADAKLRRLGKVPANEEDRERRPADHRLVVSPEGAFVVASTDTYAEGG